MSSRFLMSRWNSEFVSLWRYPYRASIGLLDATGLLNKTERKPSRSLPRSAGREGAKQEMIPSVSDSEFPAFSRTTPSTLTRETGTNRDNGTFTRTVGHDEIEEKLLEEKGMRLVGVARELGVSTQR
ncbi:MAG: hypothetical protein JXD19_05855 [Deltaproteobacteria bacterium]|nr:hypothetical protein [Deltaproteobacteria bacterium]